MTLYTTPLQFGYFLSLIMAILFLGRGIKQERLSDRLLGAVMLILALELQDYTFGFAGINFLWEELNGFPRGVGLLFGPAIYFYLRSQVNRDFTINRSHAWHALPWFIFFIWYLIFFLMGPDTVQQYQQSKLNAVITVIDPIVLWGSYGYYFYHSIQLYKAYRLWSLNEFSDTEIVSFRWFRNFIYAMIFWVVCKELMHILDLILDLSFYQDWWWNLALVGVATYVGLSGWAQKQPRDIEFRPQPASTSNQIEKNPGISLQVLLAKKLTRIMKEERLFLQPELSLSELARHLKTNSSVLSATINTQFQQNFNDYINHWRVETFKQKYGQPENQHFTMLTIAYDSGFNSKATFNRAFKKATGMSPKAYFENKE